MAKYVLAPVRDLETWDAFIARSPQRSIFTHSRYLGASGRKFELSFIYQGQQIKAGVCMVLSDDERSCELDDLVIYNGILFDETNARKPSKVRMEQFELTEFIIKTLDKQYDRIEMALNPAFEDLRPFLWYNYHSPNLKEKYAIHLRYTSYLDISELFLCNEDASTLIYKNLDNNRQSDLRKAQGNLAFEQTRDTGCFVKYYKNHFLALGKPVNPEKLTRMKNLIDSLIKDGLAMMFCVVNNQGHPTYFTVFSIFMNKGCYLFAAGDHAALSRYDGTFCLWESLKALSRFGVYEVDLEGVNSPQRGAFKMGFGGDLRPYFRVAKNSGNYDVNSCKK
jgi:hypothetical protein